MSAATERARFERSIAGRTICQALADTARHHPELPAFTQNGSAMTWGETRQQVLEVAAGFAELGMEPGDVVVLAMGIRTEHVIADLGVVHAGGVPSTVHDTLAADQIAYVASDCAAKFAVLDGQEQLDRWLPVLSELPGLRKIVVVDETACPTGERFISWHELLRIGRDRRTAAIDDRWQALAPDDTLTILYTSGTTGNPKGVIITHRMALYQEAVSSAAASATRGTEVCHIPFTAVSARMFNLYMPVVRGSHTHFCADLAQLPAVLREARPHIFRGVPRDWEQMMATIQAGLGLESEAVAAAMRVGRAYVESHQYGHPSAPELADEFAAADASVLAELRAQIGLDRVLYTMSAGAPLPIEVSRFFAGLGLLILDVYGMTEMTGAVAGNNPLAYKLGTVGRPLPGIELRLAADGEIQVRGAACTPGYLGLPTATAELIDDDGWLHTGDIGVFDADGFLSLVGRKKEIIITANGKNIAPALVENLLKAHPLIGHALVFGDRRPNLVAILTLEIEVAQAWAAARGIGADPVELAQHPTVLAEVESAVAAANARLAPFQQVRAWSLLSARWAAQSGELTSTGKLKRQVVHAKYADTFDAMYSA
ncbi:AMP-dependent synthetase/ligase [Nocardia iowensis]|uniref:Acyl-CoA synthetase n=1 Tax=Nocardia iowensis TaxID=204891 RepID=A0ABX8RLL3_NOCIO|nr:AMP-dependent synthetase/ligase [Nocardia iowensis]QXN88336.1 AMP-dependent synthetase/ligase [Nocardia iowensis]